MRPQAIADKVLHMRLRPTFPQGCAPRPSPRGAMPLRRGPRPARGRPLARHCAAPLQHPLAPGPLGRGWQADRPCRSLGLRLSPSETRRPHPCKQLQDSLCICRPGGRLLGAKPSRPAQNGRRRRGVASHERRPRRRVGRRPGMGPRTRAAGRVAALRGFGGGGGGGALSIGPGAVSSCRLQQQRSHQTSRPLSLPAHLPPEAARGRVLLARTVQPDANLDLPRTATSHRSRVAPPPRTRHSQTRS